MRDHRWPKMMLLVGAVFLVGGAASPDNALAASAKGTCLKNCRSVKKDCTLAAKSVKTAAMAVCKEDKSSAAAACKEAKTGGLALCEDNTCKKNVKGTFKQCKKAANLAFKTCKKAAIDTFKASKGTCTGDFKNACAPCCKGSDPSSCGGGVQTTCPPNTAGGPNLLTTTVVDGADLDAGWTGVGHNSGVVIGASVYACLQGCDTDTNPICTGTGPTGAGSLNGKTYGPPLPLLAADVATCVLNEFTEDITIKQLNLQTGEVEMRVKLNSVVHLTGDKRTPCPTCSGDVVGATGKCQGLTPALGKSCTVEGTTVNYGNTSSDCKPFAADNAGELEIILDPVTSGVVRREATEPCSGGLCLCPGGGNPPAMNECDDPFSCSEQVCIDNGGSDDVRKGIQPGIDQQCCKKGKDIIPCFREVIEREGEAVPGEPVWPDPTYPKTGTGKVAGVFCIPPTNSNTINQPTGLGGPGAFILPGQGTVSYVE